MKRPVCDCCEEPFTKEHPGVLWWVGRVGAEGGPTHIVKVRLVHHEPSRPTGCHVVHPRDTALGLMLFDTCSFHPTLPRDRVEEILSMYSFADDDEVWLRETFGAPKPPSIEERIRRLELLVETMIGEQA